MRISAGADTKDEMMCSACNTDVAAASEHFANAGQNLHTIRASVPRGNFFDLAVRETIWVV
jgi:hypothetical protein